MLKFNTAGKASSPNVDLNSRNIKNGRGTFVVDTGAELNLIKRKTVKTGAQVDFQVIYNLFGITDQPIKTSGEVYIDINGVACPFQIVPNNFPVSCDGMLGMPFLADSVIDLPTKAIKHKLGKFPFTTPPKKGTTLILKARTKQLVTLPVINIDLSEGYLPLLPTGPGVYLGESLATVRDGNTRVYCVNTNTRDVELSVSPVTLEEFEIANIIPGSDKGGNIKRNSEINPSSRIKKLEKELHLENLNKEEKESLLKTLTKFPYQFFLEGDKLGCTNVIQHKINTVDDVPVNKGNYRYPAVHKEIIDKETKNLKSHGAVSPSKSAYNSPVWVVPKKADSQGNKRWRMVIDYRALNEKTVGDAYPLPNITDILDQLGGAQYFTVLDLASGFHQIEIDPADRHKTAFTTLYGLFEFNRMSFGLKTAPATFQRMMDLVLSGLQGVEMFVYMDDIVVYAKTIEEHNQKLTKLLGRLKTAGLVLQPDKCRFLCKEIGYLGHVISKEGVKPDPKKVEAVDNFPRPKGRKNIKQFLGLAGYYRRFIPNFATIAKPLTLLLKKDVPFTWSGAAEQAFERLKNILCTKPLLQYPDFSKPFIITTDASNFAIGAILGQGEIGKDLPIAYASRTMTEAEINYTTTEKELLAIIFAVKHFRPYVYGRKFTLVTDHKALVWLDQLKDPTIGSRLARWKIKLQGYQYKIVYKPGRVNANADALSRNPVEMEIGNDGNDMGDEDSNEIATKCNGSVNCFAGSKVLYHEYPIERVFVSTCEIDSENMDPTESFGNIHRETVGKDVTDVEVCFETVDHPKAVSSIPKPSSGRWGVHRSVEVTETGAHVSEGREAARRSLPAAGSLKGHEGTPGSGCGGAVARASPPLSGSVVRARASGIDRGEHVQMMRAVTGAGEGDFLRHRSLFSEGWSPCGRHGLRDLSLGEVASIVEGRSPGEVVSMEEARSPGRKFPLVETLLPNKRVFCGPAGHAEMCESAGLNGRSCGPGKTAGGVLGGSVVMVSKSQETGAASPCFLEGWSQCERHGLQDGSQRILSETDRLSTDVNDRDNDFDDDVCDRIEFESLTGVWGDVLASVRENDDEGETPGKGNELEKTVLLETSQILHAGSKQGNIVLTPLFQLSKDKVWMRDDNILNFVSCDGVLTTPLSRELVNNSLVNPSYLKDPDAEVGYVTSFSNAGRMIYNLYIKEKFDSKVFAKNIENAVNTLREALESTKNNSFSISREGNGFDKFPWAVIEKMFRTHFGKGGFRITVCTGEIEIPEVEKRADIIRECHDSTVGGHKGDTKTLERIRERFYWKGMKDEVRNYVKTCETCQKRKLTRVKTKMPMRITDTPIRTFEKVQIDLVGPLPITESGNQYMLTWQDNLSKYSGAIPLLKIDSPHIAAALAENLICVFGCPETIQTDQGSQFMSNIMENIAKIFKIRQFRSSAYHPQSLGSLERSHHTFVEYLRNYGERSNWDQWLPFAIFSFNTAVHESTGVTPHEMVFGKKVRFPSEFADEKVPMTYIQLVDELLNKIVETESLATARLEAAKRRCKKYYDRKINEKQFEPDQYVYVLVDLRSDKFDDHYVGPFKITRVIDDLNVEIQITQKQTKVVHVNRIKHAFLRYI